jgi:integrase
LLLINQENIGRFRVNGMVLASGERFALLIDSETGLPDPWATRYSAVFLRSKAGSINTMTKVLRSIASSEEWAALRGIDLTRRLETGDLLTQEETVDFVNWLRIARTPLVGESGASQARAVVAPNTHYTRVMDARAYFSWRAEIAIHRIPVASGRYGDAALKLANWSRMIGGLVRHSPSGEKYGLPPNLRERFLEVIEPDSPENPFAPANRYRNFTLLLTYYELGLRRAEALVLKAPDLRLAGQRPKVYVHRRPDDPDDPRPDEPLVKTASRILSVGAKLRLAFETWVIKHRSDRTRYPGAKKTPFIFVSDNGRPMALRTVYDLFVTIRDKFPEFPRDFSPHTLRHDWNDRFSVLCDEERKAETARGIPEDERLTHAREMAMRNYLMGWKKHSQRAVTYTNRTTQARSAELILRLQERSVHG